MKIFQVSTLTDFENFFDLTLHMCLLASCFQHHHNTFNDRTLETVFNKVQNKPKTRKKLDNMYHRPLKRKRKQLKITMFEKVLEHRCQSVSKLWFTRLSFFGIY